MNEWPGLQRNSLVISIHNQPRLRMLRWWETTDNNRICYNYNNDLVRAGPSLVVVFIVDGGGDGVAGGEVAARWSRIQASCFMCV